MLTRKLSKKYTKNNTSKKYKNIRGSGRKPRKYRSKPKSKKRKNNKLKALSKMHTQGHHHNL